MVIVKDSTPQVKSEKDIHGWIKWWNWVLEDPSVPGAPVNPTSRFNNSVWTTSGQS